MRYKLIFMFIVVKSIVCNAQTYLFDSVLIGNYIIKTEAYKYSDLSLAWTCTGDTLFLDEDFYPSYPGYLNARTHTSCSGNLNTGDYVRYYADTSFKRLPVPSCDCFNGKYYGFNDSLKVQISPMPLNSSNYYYVYYGRKFWSPVTGYVGIKNHIKEIGFDVYPNPSSSSLSIVFANGYLPEQLTGMILDMAGNEVMDFNLSSITASVTIDTGKLRAGVYTISIRDHDRILTKRMVVIK